MKLTIGENIRNLCREKDMTQEELAAALGVTYQSVSRWETGACYPDLELLPELALLFGVTVDRLMGADRSIEAREVEGYLDRFQVALCRGDVETCIAVAREGVAAYPNNYALLNKLMYALFISGDDDGNIPDWAENMATYDAEITALGERIMRYCPDQNIRLEATARLAFNHCEQGRRAVGRAIYDTLPPAELCRENQIWWGLEEDEKADFLYRKVKGDYMSLRSSVWLMASSGVLDDRDAVAAYHKVFALDELINDGNLPGDGWGAARLPCELARCHLRLGEVEEALACLGRCVDAAIAFDRRPDEQSYTSLLLGSVTVRRLDFETSDSRPLCEIVRDKWLSSPDFDSIRASEAYRAIVARLG